MIVDEHITGYLHSLEADREPLLEELRLYAGENHVPIIRREMEGFICVLLRLLKAETVLEIGTGIAYSAVFMASHADSIRTIDTIENYPPRIQKAKAVLDEYERRRERRFRHAQIRLREGEASEEIRKLQGVYDLIFLDGPKAQYLMLLPELLRLLKEGGVLLADNVLQDGELVRSRFATQRRDRTVHERMRDFVWKVKHHPQLETTVVTIGDGVTVSVKKRAEEPNR